MPPRKMQFVLGAPREPLCHELGVGAPIAGMDMRDGAAWIGELTGGCDRKDAGWRIKPICIRYFAGVKYLRGCKLGYRQTHNPRFAPRNTGNSVSVYFPKLH